MIVNKIDKLNKLQIPSTIPNEIICRISAQKKQLAKLENKISELFTLNLASNLSVYPVLSSSWQQAKLTNLIQQLENTIDELKKETYLDAVCDDLKRSYELVKELTGKEYNEVLLDIIFSRFCLGK